MNGQAPSTTVMPRSRQKATAAGLTSTRSHALVHEDPGHPGLRAVADDPIGHGRRRHQEGAVDRGLDLLDPLRAGDAVHRRHLGVDRDQA